MTPEAPSSEQAEQAEIRTFLIADVRGYTRYTQEHGDEAAARLAAAFAELVERTVADRGGRLIELRGDEALVVFSSPRQAIRTAIALQHAFVERMRSDDPLPLRVGIGLDAGEAVPVGDGYRGGALNLAARLCSMAGPGEVLLTESVTHLARRVDETTYRDRGRVTLKGLEEPVRVFQVMFGLELPELQQPGRRRFGGRGLAAIAAAAIVLIAAVIAAIVHVSGSGSSPAQITANAVGQIDPGSGNLISQTSVGSDPSAVAVGGGGAWIANSTDGTVSQVDAKGNAQFVTTHGAPAGIAIGFGLVWVSDSNNRALLRISPQAHTVVGRPIEVGNGPGAVAVGSGSVWVANTLDGTVTRVDPAKGRASGVVAVAGRPDAIAFGAGSVWVASGDTATVTQISPNDAEVVRTIAVGNGASGVAFGAGAVWVANAIDGTVSRIDPSTGSVSSVVAVGAGVSTVAVSNGEVWVASSRSGNLFELDPASGRITKTVALGASLTAVAAGPRGPLWVAAISSGQAHRGGTLRVSSYMSACACLDPVFGYQADEWRLLTTMYDGLVSYRKVGGAGGATLVPDLATAIPAPTDGDRVYRFTLRPGLRFSNGRPVRASDVRATFERMMRINGVNLPPFYTSIEGAAQCVAHADDCDLSRGIAIDNAARTVTFRLSAPDHDFLYKLALPFAYVLPANAPGPAHRRTVLANVGDYVIPGTGPYTVASFTPMQRLTLRRNPYFHEFAPDAQPQGYPDHIDATLLGDGNNPDLASALPAVLAGKSDWATYLKPAQVRQVSITNAAQLHSTAIGGVQYLMLNTTIKPFSEPRARRALSFAVDRRHAAALAGGDLFARPTCQILPPTFTGYRPYCPTTTAPSAGIWSGTNLNEAHKLVAASGTAGQRVNIIVQAGDATAMAESNYAATVLTGLGYRPRVQVVANSFGASFDPRARMGVLDLGWIQDYTAPSDFIDNMFSCASVGNGPNVSRFCDPAIDRQAARASATSDQASSGERWAAVDRAIVNAQPAVPLYTRRQVDFVSRRVKNYVFNPEYGVLLDQMWVRP
jgi:ABC-type transport system substrate-binding protein/class 3 adenylate cyclase